MIQKSLVEAEKGISPISVRGRHSSPICQPPFLNQAGKGDKSNYADIGLIPFSPYSLFHLNQYQTNAWVHGAPGDTPAPNDIDGTGPDSDVSWLPDPYALSDVLNEYHPDQIWHARMSDSPWVLNVIRKELRARVSP